MTARSKVTANEPRWRKYAIEAFLSPQVPIPDPFSRQIDLVGNSNMERLEDYTTGMDAVVGKEAPQCRSRSKILKIR